jgi:hypothetical protein
LINGTVRRLASVLLLVPLAACAGAPNGTPAPERAVAGVIATVEPGPVATRVVLETSAEAQHPIVLLVERGTAIIVQQSDGALARGSTRDLVVGARIQAEHTGVELRSLAPQYHALRIWVLSRS